MKNYLKNFIKMAWPALIGFSIGQSIGFFIRPIYTFIHFIHLITDLIIFTILIFILYNIVIGIAKLCRREKSNNENS